MKKFNILFVLLCLISGLMSAQDSTVTTTTSVNANKSLFGYFMAKEAKPVRSPFESGYLIDNQTNVIPTAKTLEFVIQHRFGSMTNGISDIFGVYGTANTRLGLNYSLTDWLQIGAGTTKNYKLQDFALKVNILQQSRDNKVPVAVTYYGNLSIDATDKENFGVNYKFSNRLAYFNELMVTRKFTEWFSFMIGGSFTHFNQVDSLYEHDKIALHAATHFKVSPQSSLIINCDLPLKIDGIKEWHEIKDPPAPNFGIGWEISTSTHAFQIFVSSSNYLVPQYNVMWNQNNPFDSKENFWSNIFIGFNITRLWSF